MSFQSRRAKSVEYTSLSFLRFHYDFFNNWNTTTRYFLQSKTGHATKTNLHISVTTTVILSHGEKRLSIEMT